MNDFRIDLKALTDDEERRSWEVDDSFFATVGSRDIERGSVRVDMRVWRVTESEYELEVEIEGEVEVTCDRCLQPMTQPVSGRETLRARIGLADSDSGELITTGPDGVVDLAWHVYETIALSLPLRHVHADGECSGETARLLDQYEANQSQESDHRWDALKEITNPPR
ncbi:MAG: DUF177 domain-containing protein [Prevotellaceae bacterium]|nr:DUF177 domain-containing protein [Prevotellaceae bacterium]